MLNYDYDVAVLGGGPGGYIAALRCAQYGEKTALIEKLDVGGTCLNRGCIPTKALVQSVEIYQNALNSEAFGINCGEISYDYAKIAEYRDKIALKLRRGIEGLLKAHGVKRITGFGKLDDAHTLDVNGEKLTFDNLILATGSAPALPPIPGINEKNVLTSDDILSITELPESFVIIGGGVIGIEFANIFASLGKSVTVIEMMPNILPGVDSDIVKLLGRVLKKKKINIINNAKVVGIKGGESVQVKYELNGTEKIAGGECCLVSVGRKAMTRGIGLEELGIEMNRAFVNIDEHCRTNIENIYAIGDITGKIQLAHAASAQGLIAAANICGRKEKADYSVIPSCIYTSPEIAFVGLSEDRAKEQGIAYKIGLFNTAGNGKVMIMGGGAGMIKLIASPEGRLLGAQMICPHATDMISELSTVLRLGGTVEDISSTVHPHPTVSEAVMEAAHDFEGLCCHSLPKRER